MGWGPAAAEQTGHCSHSPARLELLSPDCTPRTPSHTSCCWAASQNFPAICLHKCIPSSVAEKGRERARRKDFPLYVHPQGAEPISICCSLEQPSWRRGFWNRAEEASFLPQSHKQVLVMKPTCQLCSSVAFFSFFFSQVAKSVVLVVCCALKEWALLSLVSSLGC